MHPKGDDTPDAEEELIFPHTNIQAVADVGEILAPSFGPTPRDKLIVSQLATRSETDPRLGPPIDDYVVTSDGKTIIQELDFDHPIAPVVRRVTGPERLGETDIEGKDITDGIKTSVLFLSALLLEAQTLIERGLHPTNIKRGYRYGLEVMRDALSEQTLEPTPSNIRAVARTALTGNDIGGKKEQWAEIAVDVATQIGVPNDRTFAVRTASGRSIDDARLISGAVLNKNERASERMPTTVENADVLVMGGAEDGGLKRKESRREISVTPSDPDYASAFDELRERHRQERFQTLLETGVDVVVAQTGISKEFQHLLSEQDILGIRGVNSLKLRQVALATGATIVYDPDDISSEMLGRAGILEEITLPEFWTERGDRRMIIFDDCPDPDSIAVLLTGVWRQLANQLKRSIRKATFSASVALGNGDYRPGCLPGGGAAETGIARAVRNRATDLDTKAQLAAEAYADAMETITKTLARNGGLDAIETLSEIQTSHTNGETQTGIVLPSGDVRDVAAAGILDPYDRKRCAYETATEVANIVVSIDDALDATFEDDPITPDEAINDDAAERHMNYLEDSDKETRWD